MKKKFYVLLFTFFLTLSAKAQCAMCRAVLESGEEQSAAEGINDGIMFLMAVPYILVATMGYFIYRKYSKPKKSEVTNKMM